MKLPLELEPRQWYELAPKQQTGYHHLYYFRCYWPGFLLVWFDTVGGKQSAGLEVVVAELESWDLQIVLWNVLIGYWKSLIG